MHRKRSSDGRWRRIRGRNSGVVHRQGKKIFQSERFQFVLESIRKSGEMKWQ
jgi:hypothetical protein